jgi:hypothetical protein
MWFSITIISIWVCSFVGACVTGDAQCCFSIAGIITVIAGSGYLIHISD